MSVQNTHLQLCYIISPIHVARLWDFENTTKWKRRLRKCHLMIIFESATYGLWWQTKHLYWHNSECQTLDSCIICHNKNCKTSALLMTVTNSEWLKITTRFQLSWLYMLVYVILINAQYQSLELAMCWLGPLSEYCQNDHHEDLTYFNPIRLSNLSKEWLSPTVTG